MRIYIAGAWAEQHERARPMMAAVRELGHEITFDWTRAPDAPPLLNEAGQTITSDAGLSKAQRLLYAKQDRDGVLNAEVLWLLAPDTKGSYGAWVELGLTLGARNIQISQGINYWPEQIIVSGPSSKRSIFTELADHLFETDAAALEWLKSPMTEFVGG